LLIGGGALSAEMGKIFESEFKIPAVIGDNSRMANALGFLERAKKKYEKELNHGTR
jgi:hypothetical protein